MAILYPLQINEEKFHKKLFFSMILNIIENQIYKLGVYKLINHHGIYPPTSFQNDKRECEKGGTHKYVFYSENTFL